MYLNYLKQCFRRSVLVWEETQRKGNLIGASIAGVFAVVWALFGITIDFVPEVFIVIVLFFSLWLLILLLFVTPYQMWRDERKKRLSLEDAVRPQLQFGKTMFEDHSDEDEGSTRKYMFIEITNAGNRVLSECIVKVTHVTGVEIPRQPYQYAFRTEARHKDHHVGRFKLGAGETKRICLTSFDILAPSHPIGTVLATEHDPIRLKREQQYTLDLVAIAEEGRPLTKSVTLFVDEWDTVRDVSNSAVYESVADQVPLKSS